MNGSKVKGVGFSSYRLCFRAWGMGGLICRKCEYFSAENTCGNSKSGIFAPLK